MNMPPRTLETVEKLKLVSEACTIAAEGPTKETAKRHLLAAVAAQEAGHDGECNRELDSARHALEQI